MQDQLHIPTPTELLASIIESAQDLYHSWAISQPIRRECFTDQVDTSDLIPLLTQLNQLRDKCEQDLDAYYQIETQEH